MSQELKNYIAEARKSGKTDNQIRQELLGAGWDYDLVGKMLTLDSSFSAVNIFKLSKLKLLKKTALVLATLILLVIYLVGAYYMASYHGVSVWPVKAIKEPLTITALTGTKQSFNIADRVNYTGRKSKIFFSSNISRYIKKIDFNDKVFEAVSSAYIEIEIPKNASAGSIEGQVSLVSVNGCIVIPIRLDITKPSLDYVPSDITRPSEDRIVFRNGKPWYVKDEIGVVFKDDVPFETVRDVIKSTGGVFMGQIGGINEYQILYEVGTFEELSQIADRLEADPNVRAAMLQGFASLP